MEDFRQFDRRRLERQARWLGELRSWRNARVSPIVDWTFTGADGKSHLIQTGDAWPVVDTPITLGAEARIPKDWKGSTVEAELWLGGEGYVLFTPGYGSGLNPFHHDFVVSEKARGGESIRIDATVVPKGMFGSHVGSPSLDRAMLTVPHAQVRALETDLRMLTKAAAELEDHDIFSHLLDLVDTAYRELAPHWPTSTEIAKTRYISGDADGGAHRNLGQGDYTRPGFQGTLIISGIWHIPPAAGALEPLPAEALDACDRARALIADGLERLKQQYPPVGRILLTGHAHIDLAWLWPVAETRRKAQRTFASVLRLMDTYDDFTFNQSSAQVYRWLEQDDPALLEQIKVRVKEGRWEPVGGSWLEPDSQVTGAEAYVRHLFYGQRYFQQTFGIQNTTAWLPDVFGFSGGIPQLLLGAGIDKFFTIKVTWSESNPFPYDLFWWEGIDGSRVLSHTFYNPGEGYNGNIEPLDTLGTWKNFKGKRLHDQTLLSFGWGDGGGGPSREMLENYARIKDFPALPRLEMGSVEDFFAELPTEDVPSFVGELYLELHRATLTTQGLVKKLNRESEHRLVEAEALSTIAALDGLAYPQDVLDENWQLLLLNQFHDILPGSSIHEVYEDTHPELQSVVATASRLRDEAAAQGAESDGLTIVNPTLTSRPVSAVVPSSISTRKLSPNMTQQIDGGTLIHAPGTMIGGFASISSTNLAPSVVGKVTARKRRGGFIIENDILQVEIGDDGTVHQVTDKWAERQTFTDRGNQLWAYTDRPRAWDAWDIDETYENAGFEIRDLDSIEIIESGPFRASIRVTRSWRSSKIVQTYRLHSGMCRIDIETDIDWHERMMLLRTRFPLAIHAHEATYETIFGVQRRPTHRNTSWERARFEVGAHRFVDLSEPSYGVAILNNGKYGHSAVGSTIGISLIRGSIYPDPVADEGEHHFTYSILPHEGDWATANVVDEALALNAPLVVIEGKVDRRAFAAIDGLRLGCGALKQAHDRDGVILRLYEPHGNRGTSIVVFDRKVKSARRVNLLESDIDGDVSIDGKNVTLDVRPFEVITLLLTFKS